MKTILILAFALLFAVLGASAQKDTVETRVIRKSNNNYSDYVIKGRNLYALTDSGSLVIWDLIKIDTIHLPQSISKNKFTAIAKGPDSGIFLGTKKGLVFRFESEQQKLSISLKIKTPVRGIAFNKVGKMFLISGGVMDLATGKIWDQFENHASGIRTLKRKRFLVFFHKFSQPTKYFSTPEYTFTDSNERLWMTAVYGEFGGEIEIFDLKNPGIVDNKFLNPGNQFPRSVFEDDKKNIYITCGLQHMMNFGEILRIDTDNTVKQIFNGERVGITNDQNKRAFKEADFVGAGNFNPYNHDIYLFASTGFYRCDPSVIPLKPQFLFRARMSWTRERMAVGYQPVVKKMDFVDQNKMLFLTQNDGFGLYDGTKLIFFR